MGQQPHQRAPHCFEHLLLKLYSLHLNTAANGDFKSLRGSWLRSLAAYLTRRSCYRPIQAALLPHPNLQGQV